MPSGQVSREALSDQKEMNNTCQDVIAKLYTNASVLAIPLLSPSCTAPELGYLLYQREDYVHAARLYEEMLGNGIPNTYVEIAAYRWLSGCYEHLGLSESAEFYARRALEIGGEVMPALNIATRLEEKGEIDEAAGQFRLACTLYLASQPLPKDGREQLESGDQRVLWPHTFSTGYLKKLQTLDAIGNDHEITDETRAQVHWELISLTRPLLNCGEELFRRGGNYGNGQDYYFATPSILPHPTNPDEDHLIIARLINYRIDSVGRYYKDYLPKDDKSGILRSACVLYTGRGADRGDVVRIMDGRFERVSYRFLGTEDPRLFQLESGEIRVFWTSWEFSKYLGEGSRIISGVLHVNTSTIYVDHLFQSPFNRFLEKNWVVFQVPGGPLRIIYEWHPLRIGTFNHSVDIDKIQLDLTIDTPLVFKHARGSTNGCFHKGELWFLIHGTTWHKGPGPIYYHRIAVLDGTTLDLKRYTYPFKLESQYGPVEFSLGMTIDAKDRLSIAYSVFDSSSVIRRIPMWKVEALMRKHQNRLPLFREDQIARDTKNI
ncbi:Hypothetical protein NocV09_00500050 [Nannochloropsis oceanica]